jgi:hypothetical protein
MSALLALFARSLRQDTRSKSTHLGRAGLIIVLLMVLGSTQALSGWAGAPGLLFFSTTMFIDFFFISLAGLSYFASAITEEKEEMTLGLLRMTNLNPLSILLGKSTSRLCGALLLLAAQLPFTLLAVAFGGISAGQIIAAYCTLAAYILLLSNLALLFSVVARRTAAAAFLTGIVLFIYLAGYTMLPAVFSAIGYLFGIEFTNWDSKPAAFLAAWKNSSPLERLSAILKTGFGEGPVGTQVVSNIAAGVTLFLLAWTVFDIFNAEQREATPLRGRVARSGSPARFTNAGRAWRHALLWKDFHFLAGGVLGGYFGSLIKLIVYGLLLGSIVWQPYVPGRPAFRWDSAGFKIMGFMAFALGMELTFAAARIFRHERRWKTLSSLAMLPVSLRSVAYQKILAALLTLWPGILYFCIGVACASDTIWEGIWKAWHSQMGAVRFSNITLGWLGLSILQALFFLHLVANLSLRVKWGAIPLAIAMSYLFSMPSMMAVMLIFRVNGAMVIPMITLLIATVALHVNTGARLKQLAAEE